MEVKKPSNVCAVHQTHDMSHFQSTKEAEERCVSFSFSMTRSLTLLDSGTA